MRLASEAGVESIGGHPATGIAEIYNSSTSFEILMTINKIEVYISLQWMLETPRVTSSL